jgi:cell wall hydrolase
VAYSILARVAHRSWWGRTILQVIGKRWQYSSMTAPDDPNLTKWPDDDDASWQESLLAANAAYNAIRANPAPEADSYFDVSIAAPAWAKPEMFVNQIGHIRFYNVGRDLEAEAGAKAA